MLYYDGRDSFWGVDCIFVESQEGMKLYPIDDEKIKYIFRHNVDVDFSITYKSDIYKNTVMNVHRISHGFHRGFELQANYVVKRIDEKPISLMEITSEAIDSLFSTVHYYYQQREKGIRSNHDLLYDIEEVNTWKIKYKDKEIAITLFYGEVLNAGIGSDIKIHPKLKIVFPETTDSSEIYDIYLIIKSFLQITRYGYNIGKTKVDLYNGQGERRQLYGHLTDYSQSQNQECSYSEVKYTLVKENIQNLLQFSANNNNMQIGFIPNTFREILNDSYDGLLFATLYASFESECHEKKEIYAQADDSALKNEKKELIDFIEDKSKRSDQNLKNFCSDIKGRIIQYGTQIGQEKKIINAYSILSKALDDILQYVFFLPSFRINKYPSKEDIKIIAKKINEFRGNVIHGGGKNTFSVEEAPFVQFLEILVYSMTLKRAGLEDGDIQRMIRVAVLHDFSIMYA